MLKQTTRTAVYGRQVNKSLTMKKKRSQLNGHFHILLFAHTAETENESERERERKREKKMVWYGGGYVVKRTFSSIVIFYLSESLFVFFIKVHKK